MSLRLRLLLLVLSIYGAGGYFITRWIVDQVRPRYLESMEETLVDTSVLLAAVVEHHSVTALDATAIQAAYMNAVRSRLTAQIFTLEKQGIDLRIYVTDAAGRVVFDSTGRHVGADFSKWNDIARTLQGRYGARSTRDVPGDDETQVIYVAAPVRRGAEIIGVVTVGKPTHGINMLVTQAKRRITLGAVTGGGVLLGILLVTMSWVIAPLERLTGYARAVRDGQPAALPPLPGRTLHDLGTAFEQMRDALEGRQHAERYTQALAHEVKAPLAGIRGAAELLDEEMPLEQRQKFLSNIRNETGRIQHIVERLLELSSIEARKALTPESIDAAALLRDCVDTLQAAFAATGVSLAVDAPVSLCAFGDKFLLRQALVNLLQNALEFSPPGKTVLLTATSDRGGVLFTVADEGPGVPEYALPKIFDRFYSLPRPRDNRKSTGIGLALVREIAHLHGGQASVSNRAEGGALATLWTPGKLDYRTTGRQDA